MITSNYYNSYNTSLYGNYNNTSSGFDIYTNSYELLEYESENTYTSNNYYDGLYSNSSSQGIYGSYYQGLTNALNSNSSSYYNGLDLYTNSYDLLNYDSNSSYNNSNYYNGLYGSGSDQGIYGNYYQGLFNSLNNNNNQNNFFNNYNQQQQNPAVRMMQMMMQMMMGFMQMMMQMLGFGNSQQQY